MGFGISVPFERFRNSRADRCVQSRRPKTHRASRTVVHEPSTALLLAKRTIDVIGAGFGLLIITPLFIGIALALKVTSPGPIFFRQKRYGYRNRRFWIYKFRTMYAHLGDNGGTCQTTTDDPRVTPIGRILRKASLDELPQLINVLKGDMS